MIDLNCHILPGIDDGPKSIERSLEMLQVAVRNGITHAVLTPHIHPGRYDNQRSTIQAGFDVLAARVRQEHIAIKLGMGAEVRIDTLIPDMIQRDEIPFLGRLGGKKTLLVEMPHSHIPTGTEPFLAWLFDHNIQPLIAHPERNQEIMRHFDRLTPLFEMGCLFQVTASSVTGAFGAEVYRVAEKLLKLGKVYILASDAHNTRHHPPEMHLGMEAAADIIGRKQAIELVLDNPMRIAGCQFSQSSVDYVL
ncbi:MAG TPA: capsular biosynthesis protein [Gammaproteobacteria bacterium]|nr:capsular biosynthesis protein [Gammaproteobacteria bacterium]